MKWMAAVVVMVVLVVVKRACKQFSLPEYCKWKNEKIFPCQDKKKLVKFSHLHDEGKLKASSTSMQKFLKTEHFLIRFEKIHVHT